MHIDDQTRIQLDKNLVGVYWDETSQLLRYSELEDVREASQAFVSAVVRAASPMLFAEVCTSCGACCRREDILVSAQEVFRMARKVGVSDEVFREKYIRPAATWSSADGYLKREDGHCVFLENGTDGSYTKCRVYDERPFTCRSFMPVSPMCVKETPKLVEHLKDIVIEGPFVTVYTDVPSQVYLDSRGASWEAELMSLVEVLRKQDEEREDKFTHIGNGLKKLLDSLKEDFDADPRSGTAYRQFMETRGVVQDLAGMTEIGDTDAEQRQALLETLWTQVLELDRRIAKADIPPGDETAASTESANASEPARTAVVVAETKPLPVPTAPDPQAPLLAGITLFPETLVVTFTRADQGFQAPLNFSAHPSLVPLAQRVMDGLVRWDVPEISWALTEETPPCFLCGECCRTYSVEILPSDIERLAWNMKLTEAQFIERYTIPGRFTWNQGNRILTKTEYLGRKQCVFLEHREDGFYYCGIHLYKPAVCAGYVATNKLCRKTNDAAYADRQVRNIIWFFVEGHSGHLCTYQTHLRQKPALFLDLRRRPALLGAVADLQREAAALLEAACAVAQPLQPSMG